MLEYMTLKGIRDQVARQIGDSSDRTATKIDDWINNHYSEFGRKKTWPQLIRSSEEETTFTSGVAHLYLPKEMEQLFFVMETNLDPAVNMAIESLLRGAGPQFNTTGAV